MIEFNEWFKNKQKWLKKPIYHYDKERTTVGGHDKTIQHIPGAINKMRLGDKLFMKDKKNWFIKIKD